MRRWIPSGIVLFQKTRAFNKFSWKQKRRVNKFFNCKRVWKTQEKIKFRFIQEPWIYLFVKIRNSQIFYVINIMDFSKFAQEIYFYLLVAILYLFQSKLNIFVHLFISSRLLCPNNDFKSSYSRENITKSCIFESNFFFLAIVLRCWNPVEYIQNIIISFLTVPLDEMNYEWDL